MIATDFYAIEHTFIMLILYENENGMHPSFPMEMQWKMCFTIEWHDGKMIRWLTVRSGVRN